MSFILNALGNLGRNFLGGFAGDLLGGGGLKANLASRITNHFTGAFNDQQKMGRTAMDHMYSNVMDKAMGGIQNFAKSNLLMRKVPMLAQGTEQAANTLRDRLNSGYFNATRSGGGGGGGDMDGIERQRMDGY